MIVNKYANGNGGGGTGSTITVDAALSSSSTNPVQNKVITNALGNYVTSGDVQDIVDEAVSSSMTGYATEQYVDDAIAGIVIPEPPEDYATTGDVADAVAGLASESYVDDAIASATEHMVTTDDLQDYATEQYVDDAVNGLAQGIGMLGMVNDVSESNGTVTVMKTTMQEGQLVTGSTSFNIVTSGDVATAITAATQNFATEQYVNNAVSSATTEIYEYVDAAILTGATITVDDHLDSASTNPVENQVITSALADYVTKDELTGVTATPVVFGEESDWIVSIWVGQEGSFWIAPLKATNISNIFGFYLPDYGFTVEDFPNGTYFRTIEGLFGVYEPSADTTASTETHTQLLEFDDRGFHYYIIPSALDGTLNYYLFFDANTKQVWLSKTAVIGEDVPGILDDYVTSGDVEDMIEDVVATAITIDTALSTGSTNPVENRVIANKFGNYYTKAETDAVITAATQNFVTSGDVTTAITSATQNFITSGDVTTIVDAAVATAITIDSALSTGSTNPVQNQVITNALGTKVESTDVHFMVKLTQAEYDAMQSHDPNTFYIIVSAEPETMGVWSGYTFQIQDTDYTNWVNEVNIGKLVGVYYENTGDMDIKLSAPSSGSWHLEFYDPEVTLCPSYDFAEGTAETWEDMGVMIDPSDTQSGIVVSWDGVDTFTFSDGSQDSTLVITTIDPEYPEGA